MLPARSCTADSLSAMTTITLTYDVGPILAGTQHLNPSDGPRPKSQDRCAVAPRAAVAPVERAVPHDSSCGHVPLRLLRTLVGINGRAHSANGSTVQAAH